MALGAALPYSALLCTTACILLCTGLPCCTLLLHGCMLFTDLFMRGALLVLLGVATRRRNPDCSLWPC